MKDLHRYIATVETTKHAALAAASGPLDAKAIAAQFRKTKTSEGKIAGVLASLARLGHVATDGKTFTLRRVA
ncbi:hypothetical protein [Nitrobacter hamburgensis]|uniref:hypothetical protein n=1 Tax=Nitrobacter hamburgensis TaxID=912 RepID=UPI00005541F5|nr:hypothetical protein [Nitrobacter hamburgensis]